MGDKEKKVLVIDDDPDILELLEYNLKKAGYRVVTASAKGSPEDIRKGLAQGADKYLPKSSFTMETLLKEVRDVL